MQVSWWRLVRAAEAMTAGFQKMGRNSLKTKGPEAKKQLDQEKAREDETGMLEALANLRNPGVIFDPLITVNQSDEDIRKKAGNIEGDEGENQVMLLFRNEQVLASTTMPSVSADFLFALVLFLVILILILILVLFFGTLDGVSLTLKQRLLFVILVGHCAKML